LPEQLPMPGKPGLYIPAFNLPYGMVPLPEASPAMMRVIGLAYLLVWAQTEPGTTRERPGPADDPRFVVLIDDIDAHLSPSWQRTIVPAIIRLVDAMHPPDKVQFVMTTQSGIITRTAAALANPALDRLFMVNGQSGPDVTIDPLSWDEVGTVFAES